MGLVFCALIWGVLRAISLIPGVGPLAERRESRYGLIALLTIVSLAVTLVSQMGGGLNDLFSRPLDLAGYAVAALLLSIVAVTLLRPAALAETGIALREGVLWPLTITAIVMSVLAVLGLFVVRNPTNFLDSLVRAPVLLRYGQVTQVHNIPAPPNQFDEPAEVAIPVSFRRDEIRQIVVASDQRVKLRTESFDKQSPVAITLDLPAGEERQWRRVMAAANPFREPVITQLFVKNYGTSPAAVKLTTTSTVAVPETMLAPVMAVCMAGVFLAYLFQRAAAPKLAAVALSTTKSEIAQPLFAIIMGMGIFGLIVSIYVPYFTLSSDIKMLKDSGMAMILILCAIQAVWSASSSVADEVDGKTALTVLSKPVSRRDFILGKFAGIGWAVGLMMVMLGLLFLVTIAYKPIYDAREGGYTLTAEQLAHFQSDPNWMNCFAEMVQVVPGLVLVFLEVLVMAALSVAISTRLPTLANFVISFSIYVLGHLTPLLVQSQEVAQQLPPVVFFGRLIATVLPVLDHFNVQASVAAGVPVPGVYLTWALVYCVLYSAVAMLLALTLFEDRDLA